LFEALAVDGLTPDVIVHFWSLLESGAGSAYPVFNSALAICRRLQLVEGSNERRLLFVTSGSQSVSGEPLPHPQRAMLVGAARVAPREIPRLRAQVVDIDSPSSNHVPALLREIDAGIRDELVAYRGEDRWIQGVCRTSLALAAPPGRLRQNGTYLITGGFGDVGLLLADYLARAVSANLVLLGRTKLPPKKRWRQTLRNDPRTPEAARIRALMALKAAGVETLALNADIASEAELSAALTEARVKFGQIDGVFHAAGALRDAPIALKAAAEMRDVIDSKTIGAENLHKLLPEGAVDFFAVFSSTSALAGISGQIDYAGANAAAAAIAESRRDGIAIYWGAWSDVGMAARAYGLAEPRGKETGHPLLGLVERHAHDRASFYANHDPSVLWPVREHVVDGAPTLPASAYLEIVNAAARILDPRRPPRIRNLSILTPMTFLEAETRQVRISVKSENSGFGFVIESFSSSNPVAVEHARAQVEPAPLVSLADPDGDTVREIAQVAVGNVLKAPQGDSLAFGPRWQNIRGLARRGGKAIGVFVLPDAFHQDRSAYLTHPALCDMAMSVGLSLVDAEDDDAAFYAPISIDTAEFADTLTTRVYSVATLVERSNDSAVFDVSFFDERHKTVAEIRGIAFRRVLRGAMAESSQGNNQRDTLLRSGIRSTEATSLFDHVLRSSRRNVIISPTPLTPPAKRKPDSDKDSTESGGPSGYSDPVERALERIWCDLLGVERVTPQDDFFALGGHSLIAVRLFARIRSEFNVDLPLASLFKAPRLPMLAKLVHDNETLESTLPGAAARSESRASDSNTAQAQDNWTPLFNVRKGKSGKTPLFLVPGGEGGYFKLRELAPQLRDDWPIFVLRMRGLEDSLTPHESIEAIAAANIEGIRSIQPSGPYRLGGYSAGGVVAFEMTHQLQNIGEYVEAFIMFDPLCPDRTNKQLNFWERIWAARLWSASYAIAYWKYLCSLPAKKMTGGTVAALPVQISDEPDRAVGKYATMFAHYMRLQAKYKLRRLKVNVILLRASSVNAHYFKGGRCLGWRRWIDGSIKLHSVDSNHHTLFVQPALMTVAKIVQTHLHNCDVEPISK
jgi:thioesterase domain-containing protein/acyl carrier protein